MTKLYSWLRGLVKRQRGQDMVEYALTKMRLMPQYVVEPREPLMSSKRRFWVFRKRLVDYDLPWALYRGGRPIGFYATVGGAIAASPKRPWVRLHSTRTLTHAQDLK